ncbi:MAG: ATP-binding protein [Motilibacteraceae bacterium]
MERPGPPGRPEAAEPAVPPGVGPQVEPLLHVELAAFQSLPNPVALVRPVLDPQGEPVDLEVVWLNDAAATDLLGTELLGRRLLEALPAAATSGAIAQVASVLRTGRALAWELNVQLPRAEQGDWWRCRMVPTHQGILAWFQRTTRTHHLAAALEAAERRFAEVRRLAGLATWEWRFDQAGAQWSDELFELVGLEPLDGADLEATGGRFMELVDPADRELLGAAVAEVRASGRVVPLDLHVTRPDGIELVLRSDAVPMLDEEGTLVGVRGTMTDVSEERSLQSQLQQAQRSEVVGQVAAGVAHDFNNLLAVVGMNAALLRATMEQHGLPAGEAQAIEAMTTRAASLTRQLLALSGQQVLAPEDVSLLELVTQVLPLLRRAVDTRVDVRAHGDPHLPTVRVDVGQMEQVLLNLVLNARDAIPGAGTITISVTREPVTALAALAPVEALPLQLRTALRDPSRHRLVALRVADDGQGMSADVLERALEPFFTTHPGSGTGLGLSVAQGVVGQLGGHLTLESVPDEGTTASVWFPVLAGAAPAPRRLAEDAAAAAAVDADQPDTLDGRHVLVVEDNDDVRSLCVRLLASHGCVVTALARPEAALAMAVAELRGYSVLVSDIVMPTMDGDEMARILRQRHPDLAVVLVSGYAGARADLAREGFVFVPKPFTADGLALAVRGALAGARGGQG